jgi:hypothetical protein
VMKNLDGVAHPVARDDGGDGGDGAGGRGR